MLHLCSGDMGLQAWREAGLPGEALPWRDSPAVGPWNPDPDLRSRLRAQFWGLPPETAAFREEEEVLQSLRRAGSVVLWFSAEPWDQMAQLWVLARLARVLEDRPPLVPGRTERQVRELEAAGIRDLSRMMRALAALEAPYGQAWYGDLVVKKLMESR